MAARLRGVRALAGALCAVTLVTATAASPAAGALPNTSTPTLNLIRTIRTSPFVGTSVSPQDNEGGAFVPNSAAHPNRDGTDSIWMSDDNGLAIREASPYTGVLKSVLGPTDWAATRQYDASTDSGSGPFATSANWVDLEGMAYDQATDTLYVFNGKCCTSSVRPAVFRLRRTVDGSFRPESWQPLPLSADYTGAAWNPADGKLYVGVSSSLRTYDYRTNVSGPTFGISGVSGIFGLGFSDTGTDLFIVTSGVRLIRVQWSTRTVMPGWSFDLRPFGIVDSRAVEPINDQFYVFDGYDGRRSSPLSYAVFVLGVCCDSQTLPTANFNATQLASPARTVQFTDTSTGSPTSWSWSFGDNTSSTSQSPTHTYATAGTYTVTLVASNANGPSAPFSRQVTVSDGSASPAIFNAVADTYVVLATPTTSYGTDSNLHVKRSSSNDKRGYFKFSVSGLAGRTVSSAKLRLYVTDPSDTGGSVFSVSSDWIETGTGALTWSNMPPPSGGALSTLGPVVSGTFVEFDVTGAISGDGTYSFVVTSPSSDTVYYASRESANDPQLVLTFA